MVSFKYLLVLSVLAHQAFLAYAYAYCSEILVPALYVFGDSTVDAGNNNNLKTLAKANVFPYGIDFNNCSSGRFSNGKTFADIIAIMMGLPMPPPYLGVSEIQRYHVATGINYASASSGILNSTGNGEFLSLDKQIEYFTSTVKKDLPIILRSKENMRHHLSKSIYLLSTGSNDYVLNYLQNGMGSNKTRYPEEFANYLLKQLASRLKRIYDLGARKFVIAGVGPIGCIPACLIRTPHSQDCNENINQRVKPYSNKLPEMLQELQTQLAGSLFINLDNYNFFKQIRISPEKFGIKNIYDACVWEGAKPCENRKQYYFYDPAHTSEAANVIIAKECFSGAQACFPLNIKKLVHAH